MMWLSEIAQVVHGQLRGADMQVNSVGTDTRTISAQQLFVAIKGERFDGNQFATEALAKGAAAVLISDANSAASPAVLVADTRLALGQLAAHWRQQLTAPVAAITGSNGKTTTKEMLHAILAAATGDAACIHATYGNLNNDIGLPLTLLKARAQHQYLVLEMGMNHLGEIDYLTHIAKPNVAVINNAGMAHIGELGSRELIAQAKGEIFAGLAVDGVAVINADDRFADYWRALNTQRKVLTFGLSAPADVSAHYTENSANMQVQLTTPTGTVAFTLPVLGVHNLYNALAASTAAVALGIANASIAQGLSQFSGVKGRLQHKAGVNGAILIDDTYNANPDSMKAAIDVLSKLQGATLMVMGDMGELGADAAIMHAEVGRYAKAKGIHQLMTFGDLSAGAAKAFGANAQHFTDLDALVSAVKSHMQAGVAVLVKGSRFMRMERVVDLLEAGQTKQVQKA